MCVCFWNFVFFILISYWIYGSIRYRYCSVQCIYYNFGAVVNVVRNKWIWN